MKARAKAPKVPLLLAAWRAVMKLKARYLFFSLSFFAFRVLIMSFPQRRKKVVCKAKRPKHFSFLHGKIKCDLWACHFELSGAKNEQIARKLTSCSHLLRSRRLQFLLFCWKSSAMESKEINVLLYCKKISSHLYNAKCYLKLLFYFTVHTFFLYFWQTDTFLLPVAICGIEVTVPQ